MTGHASKRPQRSLVALAMPPPYEASPWLGMGLVLVRALLRDAGIGSRILRLLNDPAASPEPVIAAAMETSWGDSPLPERLRRAKGLVDAHARFFDPILDCLCEVPEPIVGLSVWRHNADVTLELTRRLHERAPEKLIVLGGPEAINGTADLVQPWIDAIVSTRAEAVVGTLFEALVDETPERAAALEGVWLGPRLSVRGTLQPITRLPSPPLPSMGYDAVMDLFAGDPRPDVPFLLNLGCPFRCTFCSNTNVYPELHFGDAERVVADMDVAVEAWLARHGGRTAPPMTLSLCDAAANAWPDQFDRLCDAIIARDWPVETSLQALIIVDGRLTPERVERYVAAGLTRPFFGLETASPRLRRQVKKPGRIEDVRRALEAVALAEGRMRLNLNVIVGFPDETEAEFLETLEFLEWAVDLGVLCDVSVVPLMRNPHAMGPTRLEDATGSPRGFNWTSTGPGGDPGARATRVLAVFDRLHGRVKLSSPVPRDLMLASMLPELPRSEVDAVLDRYGRWTCYFESEHESPAEAASAPRDEAHADHVATLLRSLGTAIDGFTLDRVEATPEAAVAVFHGETARIAVEFRPDEDGTDCLTRAAGLAISYRQTFRGDAYADRPDWVRGLSDRLRAAQRR